MCCVTSINLRHPGPAHCRRRITTFRSKLRHDSLPLHKQPIRHSSDKWHTTEGQHDIIQSPVYPASHPRHFPLIVLHVHDYPALQNHGLSAIWAIAVAWTRIHVSPTSSHGTSGNSRLGHRLSHASESSGRGLSSSRLSRTHNIHQTVTGMLLTLTIGHNKLNPDPIPVLANVLVKPEQ